MEDQAALLRALTAEREAPSRWWRTAPQLPRARRGIVREVIHATGRAGVKKQPH